MTNAADVLITVPQAFAMFGGVLGAILVADLKRYGWLLSGVMIVSSLIASIAISDYFLAGKSHWLYSLAGLGIGCVTGSFLDALKAIAPGLANKIVNKLGSHALNSIPGSTDKPPTE